MSISFVNFIMCAVYTLSTITRIDINLNYGLSLWSLDINYHTNILPVSLEWGTKPLDFYCVPSYTYTPWVEKNWNSIGTQINKKWIYVFNFPFNSLPFFPLKSRHNMLDCSCFFICYAVMPLPRFWNDYFIDSQGFLRGNWVLT